MRTRIRAYTDAELAAHHRRQEAGIGPKLRAAQERATLGPRVWRQYEFDGMQSARCSQCDDVIYASTREVGHWVCEMWEARHGNACTNGK